MMSSIAPSRPISSVIHEQFKFVIDLGTHELVFPPYRSIADLAGKEGYLYLKEAAPESYRDAIADAPNQRGRVYLRVYAGRGIIGNILLLDERRGLGTKIYDWFENELRMAGLR